MDSLSLHRGGWRDARAVLQALFAELAVYLNRAGGWAAQAPTTDLRTPPPTSRSPTRTKQPICRCNNIPRHFLRPTMIEFALLFTCFRKLGPGFRKPSAGPVGVGRAGGPLWCGPNLGAGAFPHRKAEARCSLSAERPSLLSSSQVAIAPYCAPLSAQPRPAAGRATEWPGPPSDRPPQSASVEEVSRLA